MKQPLPAFVAPFAKRPNFLSRLVGGLCDALVGIAEAGRVAHAASEPVSMVKIHQLCQAISDDGGDMTDDHPIMETHRDVLKASERLGLVDLGSYWIPLIRLTEKGEALLREGAL